MTSVYMYTLYCPDDMKYFVGISPKQQQFPKKYFEEQNPDYTYLTDHQMTELQRVKKIDADSIDFNVIQMMQMHGILNVRGGSYLKLKEDVINELLTLNEFKKKRRCALCLSNTHTSKKCVEYNSDDDSEYVPSEHDDDEDDDDDISDDTDESDEEEII
jgi:hypothetical protein